MKAEIRQKWIAELRSGNRKQTQGALRSTSGEAFCCLGVLCDLYDSTRWVDFAYREGENDERTGMPPRDVLLATGLLIRQADMLATANDAGGTFAEIADIIEREIPAE